MAKRPLTCAELQDRASRLGFDLLGVAPAGGFDRSRCISEFQPSAALAALQHQMLRFPTPHTRLQCAACIDACPIGKKVPTRFWVLDPI